MLRYSPHNHSWFVFHTKQLLPKYAYIQVYIQQYYIQAYIPIWLPQHLTTTSMREKQQLYSLWIRLSVHVIRWMTKNLPWKAHFVAPKKVPPGRTLLRGLLPQAARATWPKFYTSPPPSRQNFFCWNCYNIFSIHPSLRWPKLFAEIFILWGGLRCIESAIDPTKIGPSSPTFLIQPR